MNPKRKASSNKGLDVAQRGAHKTCCACGTSKPLGEFHVKRASRDGRQARCAVCNLEQALARRAREGYCITADSARRYAGSRFPDWANTVEIDAVYRGAWLEGHPAVVDHIIPLRGKLVTGLHVHQNLRVITWRENLDKGNQFNPDTFVGP